MDWLLLFPTFWAPLAFAHIPVIYNHDLATKLYNRIIKEEQGNLVFSPSSLVDILALVQTGAKGATATELHDVFNLGKTRQEVIDHFQSARKPFLNKVNSFVSRSANKVYVRQGLRIKNLFKVTAVNVFDADIENVNFTNSMAAAEAISKWVAAKTEKRITKMLSPDDLNPDTGTVLVNALYFKSNWTKRFTFVGKSDFFADGTERVYVDAMKLDTAIQYNKIKDIEATLLEVPLGDIGLTFNIVLPDERDGLPFVERNLEEVFRKRSRRLGYMTVVLPKFKAVKRLGLHRILQEIGVKTIFGDNADLSGIADERIKVDKVFQKTYFSVNENGVEAPAATATNASLVSAFPDMLVNVNHPFFFYIQFKGNILFAGRIVNPLT